MDREIYQPPFIKEARSSRSVQAYLRDALRSAATGHSPLFSDDDVFMLTSAINKPLPLEEATRTHQSGDPEANFWLLMGAFMVNLGEFTRTIAARLTSRTSTFPLPPRIQIPP